MNSRMHEKYLFIRKILDEVVRQSNLGNDTTLLFDLLSEADTAYNSSSVCPFEIQRVNNRLRYLIVRARVKEYRKHILFFVTVLALLCSIGWLSFLALIWCFTTHPI